MTSGTQRPSGATLKRRLSKSICGVESRPMGSAGLVAKDEDTIWYPAAVFFRTTNRVRMWNIIINAIAVMLVYSSYYGGAAVMPTAFTDMEGRNGIDNHTAFTGLMINNMFVVIAAFFTPFAIKRIGLRLSLIIGSMCTIPISVALFVPYNYTIFIAQAINGMGNAFSRAVSLQFLAENSTKKNMARNSGIHWMIFMSCILFGNTVLYFGIGNKHFLDDRTRMVVAGALTAMCSLGCVMYCLTKDPPPLPEVGGEDDEETLILGKELSDSDDSLPPPSPPRYNSINPTEETGLLSEEDISQWGQFKESLEPLFHRRNIYLLLPLCSTGIYSQLYTPLIPSYIGTLFRQRSFIAQFGIFVGIGEILGGRLAGKIVSYLGFKKASIFVTTLGVGIYLLIAFMFPLFYTSQPILDPNQWGNNMLGVAIGVVDVSNNVIITTAIGTVFKDNSAQIFTLVVLMMNSSGIIRYIMMSYMPLIAIVSVNIIGLVGSCGSLCLIPLRPY